MVIGSTHRQKSSVQATLPTTGTCKGKDKAPDSNKACVLLKGLLLQALLGFVLCYKKSSAFTNYKLFF